MSIPLSFVLRSALRQIPLRRRGAGAVALLDERIAVPDEPPVADCRRAVSFHDARPVVESVVFDLRPLRAVDNPDQPVFRIPNIRADTVARQVSVRIIRKALGRTPVDDDPVVLAVGVPARISSGDGDRVRACGQCHGLLKASADLRGLRGLPCNRHRRFLCGRPGEAHHPTAAQRGQFVDVVKATRAQDFISPLGCPVVQFIVSVVAGGASWFHGVWCSSICENLEL